MNTMNLGCFCVYTSHVCKPVLYLLVPVSEKGIYLLTLKDMTLLVFSKILLIWLVFSRSPSIFPI